MWDAAEYLVLFSDIHSTKNKNPPPPKKPHIQPKPMAYTIKMEQYDKE